jgi:hypothetical protein
MKNNLFLKSLIILFTIFTACTKNKTPDISIVVSDTIGTAAMHGVDKLIEALDAKNISYEKTRTLEEAKGKSIIFIHSENTDAQITELLSVEDKLPQVAEALSVQKVIWQDKTVWMVRGYDENGLMYALLDIAGRISWSKDKKSPLSEVKEISEKPDVKTRSISIYTMNRAYWESRFYDEAYWEEYLDMLAKNRFNSLLVIFGYENGGFLAPCYPYFFDVDGFPDVKMNITPEEQQKNLEALNRLIEMAHERGIRFSVGIWDHIYRGGVQRGGIPETEEETKKLQSVLVSGLNEDNLIPYTLKALEEFVSKVHGLDGIQFRMHNESGLRRNEMDKFWHDVFQKMTNVSPNLRFDLRAKELPESVIQTAVDLNLNFRITTKYWMEQAGLPFHPTHINRENQMDRRHGYADMLYYPKEYNMFWRLWTGGTMRILLWGDPEYARRFSASTHLYDGEGLEVNEPLATKMEAQPHDEKPFELLNPEYQYYDYEFERYWYFFKVYGRIGYNPETPPEVFQKEFELRFGEKAAPIVKEALEKASQVLPRIVASCIPYGGFPTTRGWPEKQRLGDLPQYAIAEGSDIQQFASFDTEAKLLIEGGETAKIKPSQTSLWFKQTSDEINQLIAAAEQATGNNKSKEFVLTMTDLRILSNLALYHSQRIPAAVSYQIFQHTKSVSALDEAIKYEKNAIEAWQKIVEAASDIYSNNLKMGVDEAEYMGIAHRLSGHWKDELSYLETGLQNLMIERENYQPQGTATTAPKYKEAELPDNSSLFQVDHNPVTETTEGQPIKIDVKVTATAGIKWVRLRYRNINQTQDYQSMNMLQIEEKDVYSATVPPKSFSPKWDFMYFIEIMDNNGNGTIYPYLEKETPYVFTKLIRE